MADVGQEYINPNPIFPQHPARISVFGASGTGKTYLLRRLLLDPDSPWNAVVWVGRAKSVRQSAVADLERHFGERMTTVVVSATLKNGSDEEAKVAEEVEDVMERNSTAGYQQIVVFDDLMTSTAGIKNLVSTTFTTARHLNASVVELLQRVFTGGNKDNRLNSTHFFLFEFGDQSDAQNLFKAVSPLDWKKLMRAYRDETARPHGYLHIDQDARHHSEEGLRALRVRGSTLDSVFPELADV